jgi:hypothetical protein
MILISVMRFKITVYIITKYIMNQSKIIGHGAQGIIVNPDIKPIYKWVKI